MTERVETTIGRPETAKLLPDQVTRKLILTTGRSGLFIQDFDDFVVRNQAQFKRGTDDYVAMVTGHQNTIYFVADTKVLGIREEVRKKCVVTIDDIERKFVETTPFVKNIWVGEHVKLLTPEQAAKTHYGGQTALNYATVNKIVPEMIVRANNGYFYPATKNDTVISNKS